MSTNSPPTRRPRSPRGAAATLRAEITAAALDVIDEEGAQALTLRGLARSIGVSAPAIYAHFANTDAILLAVAERAFADLAAQLTAARQNEPADDPVQGLRALCRSYLHYAETRPGRYLVMFGGQWDARVAIERGTVRAAPVIDLGQNVLAAIDSAVAAFSQGADLPARTVAVWVLLHGYAHQRLVSSAFPWPPDMTERLVADALRLARR